MKHCPCAGQSQLVNSKTPSQRKKREGSCRSRVQRRWDHSPCRIRNTNDMSLNYVSRSRSLHSHEPRDTSPTALRAWLLHDDARSVPCCDSIATGPAAHCKEHPIYVFPENKLRGLSPNFYIHISVRDLYVPTIGTPILLQPNRQTNVEIGTEAAQCPFSEYFFQCSVQYLWSALCPNWSPFRLSRWIHN